MGAITKSMRKLMVSYAAHVSGAESMESIGWDALATKLQVPVGAVEGALESLNPNERNELWGEIVERRVERANANAVFTRVGWEQVESKAVATLERLLTGGLIRDPSELLAITKVANQVNGGQSLGGSRGRSNEATVNFNIGFNGSSNSNNGEDGEGGDDMNHIPGNLGSMKIDLSPRSAQAMQQARQMRDERIIDAERVDVETLRTLDLSTSKDSEGDSA